MKTPLEVNKLASKVVQYGTVGRSMSISEQTVDADAESFDGRRLMAAKTAATGRLVAVLNQFSHSIFIAKETTFDVRVRVYKGLPAEKVVRMARPVNFDEWLKRAAHALEFQHCFLRDPDTGGMLLSKAALQLYLHDFAQLELSRKMDVCTVWTERALAHLIDAHHADQRERGAKEVWELACRFENHGVVSEFAAVFHSLCKGLGDLSFGMRTASAAALFALAEVPTTLARMPVAEITRALLAASVVPSNREADGNGVVQVLGALNKFIGTKQGAEAFLAAGGVAHILPLIRMPQTEVRRAGLVCISSALELPELPAPALLQVCARAADFVALGESADDAPSVRTVSYFLLAHAVRRAWAAHPPASLAELLTAQSVLVVRGIEVANDDLAALTESGKEDSTAMLNAEALLEGACGCLWSLCGCLTHMGHPVEIGEPAIAVLLPLALSSTQPALGCIAAGVLSFAKPSDALADAAGEEGVCARLLPLLEHLVNRTKLTRRHELLGAAIANWSQLASEHNRLQARGGLGRVLALCSALSDKSAATGRIALRGLAASLHTVLACTAMQLSSGDAIDPARATAPVDTEVVVQALRLLGSTKLGKLYGSGCLFGLARGASTGFDQLRVNEIVGEAGGIEALGALFRSAVEDGRAEALGSWEQGVAHLSSAALWLLVYDEANATRLTRVGTDLLMRIAQGALQVSTVVQTMCVGIISKLMRVEYLSSALMKDGAGSVLAAIGEDAHKSGTQRVLAATALNEVAQSEAFRGDLADATDAVMVSLVNARGPGGNEDMQLVACRSLARIAFGARKRRLLEIGATRELLRLVKAHDASVALRELALNALLNLSGEERNQVVIAKACIFHLAALLYTPPSELCAQHVSEILSNLALNQANRSLMYRAELVLKHAMWAGLSEIDPEAAVEGRPRERGGPGMHAGSNEEGEPHGLRAAAARRGKGKARQGAAADQRERYLSWIDTVLADDAQQSPQHSSRLHGRKGGRPAGLASLSPSPSRLHTASAPELERLSALSSGVASANKRAAQETLPQLMCRPFHESWKMANDERSRTAAGLSSGFSALAGASSLSLSAAMRGSASTPLLPIRPATATSVASDKLAPDGNARPATATGASLLGEEEPAADGEHVQAEADVLTLERQPSQLPPGVLESASAMSIASADEQLAASILGGGPAAMRARAGESFASLGRPSGMSESIKQSSVLLSVDEETLAGLGSMSRWFPCVVDVEQPKFAVGPSTPDEEVRARMLRIKGKAERPFTIRLDPSTEVIGKWRFEPLGGGGLGAPVPGPDDPFHEADASKASMIAWRGKKGCRYSRGLFAEIPLPDGQLAHVYYLGHKKNAVNPGPMPEAAKPSGMDDFGIDSLPQRPPAPQPGPRDPPGAKVLLTLTCPVPEAHTLPVSDPSVWFGTVPTSLPCFDVEARALIDLGQDDEVRPDFIKPWTVDDSLFAPRKKYSDARSYWNSASTTARAFEIDFARLNQERFRLLIQREHAGGGDDEMSEVKETLSLHRDMIYSAFMWYASTNRSMDGYVMNGTSFTIFCTDCKIADRESPFCKTKDLDKLFIVQNVEEDTGHASELNAINPNRALLRFELFQIIVRIAIEKYVKPGIITDVSEATEKLLVDCIAPNLPAGARVDTDVFRNWKLYTKPCDDVFRRYLPSLKAIYKHYSALIDDVGMRNEVLSADEFTRFCQGARLIDGEFTKREAFLCFAWSQMFVTDEIRRREKMLHCKFPDFLEAIARITCFKAFPSDEEIDNLGCTNCGEYLDRLVLDGTLKTFNATHAVDWQEEQEEGCRLEDVLDKLLATIVHRLDTDSNGYVDARDFALAEKV